MAFKKDVLIYDSGRTRVFINQCHAPGRKTNIYAVRRDDDTGLGHYLGSIEFRPAWRQYVFIPDEGTIWSAGCMSGIIKFIEQINKEWRAKHR